MGIFAFRRMREQEAAKEVAPVLLTPKKKPKDLSTDPAPVYEKSLPVVLPTRINKKSETIYINIPKPIPDT